MAQTNENILVITTKDSQKITMEIKLLEKYFGYFCGRENFNKLNKSEFK